MTQEEIDAILSMGTSESEVADLLRQVQRQEDIGDQTRGRDYLMDAGNMKVANPYQAVADMFIRGNADKKAKEAEGAVANKRREQDERAGVFHRAASGLGLGGVDLHADPEVKPGNFPMPSVPPIGGPPPAGPVGPPPVSAAGAGAPPSPVQAPGPAIPPAPAPAPHPAPLPPPNHSPGAPGRPPTPAGFNPYGGIAEAGGGIADLLAKLLRRG